MPLNIRSWNVDGSAERLPVKTSSAKTEAARHAFEGENHRLDERLSFRERLRQIQRKIQSWPATGLDANKAFFDDLSGEA